jgi:hypothetical protein
MRNTKRLFVAAGAIALLAGCATQPTGPMVRVFPAPYKPFDVFQRDQYDCEQYASQQITGEAERANSRAVGAAAIGTAIGLALGAATGDGHAATAGAVAGGAVGTAVGADQSNRANFSLQRRYDIAYSQCMYARGNQVPGFEAPYGPPPPPPPGRQPAPPPRRNG